MNIIIICIVVLVALAIIVMVGTKLFSKDDGDDVVVVPASDCSTCDGTNAKCEQVCQMEAATKPVEYFDDEELDTYAGRESDRYTDDEAAQFAEVLETLRHDEVRPWSRSLILRGINMPDQIKDEFYILVDG